MRTVYTFSAQMSTPPENSGSSKALLQRFIDAYKDLPELWDSQNPNYVRKDKRNAGYEKLLDILRLMKNDATVDDVKRKLNTLRSNFRRELKKVHDSKRSGVTTEEVYEPSSWVFYELLFLKDLEKPTKNRGSVEAAPEGGDEESCSTRPLEILTSPQPLKKIRVLRTSEHASDPPATKRPESSGNSYENFGRYVAARLEDIERKSPETCSVVRKLINDAIFEGEMGTLRSISRIVTPSDGHFIMQIPAPLQCPVVAPDKVQCPVTAPEIVQRPVTAPEIVQRPVTAPDLVQRLVTAPEIVQRPVTAPEIVQRPVTAPDSVQLPVTVLEKVQHPVTVLEKVQLPVTAPEKVQRRVTAPEKVQCLITAPEKVQRLVTAPEKAQRPVTAPEKVQRSVTAPGKAQSPAVILE
ncbi:uncharacterized protein [Macrobrachium rosenbergii]|uniref:uncharacterized protein n=1 Tax=Macrobrachium rosenbergii TaxID=79674 RepID=UPI0034D68FFF